MEFFKTYTDAEVLLDVIKSKPHHKADALKILDNDETKYHLLKIHFDERLDYIVDDDIVHDIIDFLEIDIEKFGVFKGSFIGMKLKYEQNNILKEVQLSGKCYEVFDYYVMLSNTNEFYGFFKKLPHITEFILGHCQST